MVIARDKVNPNRNDDWVSIEIVQQKFMPDQTLWVVCRCPFSGQVWRCDPDDGFKLAKAITAGGYLPIEQYTFNLRVAIRIVRGYTDPFSRLTDEG